ncbi:hypothetical protein MKEN_00136800 [Mycena kentingensis (nom. inval.)]|nr:hypothetical protein MKEN_00136800 [Mycena kentingensis (nom. inval.)]
MSTTPFYPPTQYVHYQPQPPPPPPPPQPQPQPSQLTVSPQDTQRNPVEKPKPKPKHPAAAGAAAPTVHPQPSTAVQSPAPPTPSTSAVRAPSKAPTPAPSQQPIVAKGDWTKDLVQLAKTAELKQHALTLQLHTAHILSAHAALEQKTRTLAEVREQKNRLETERKQLIEALSRINDQRTEAEVVELSLEREQTQLREKITSLSEREYAEAKAQVDVLRRDLGQPPLPSLQETLAGRVAHAGSTEETEQKKRKRASTATTPTLPDASGQVQVQETKRPRGRPRKSAVVAPAS